MEGYAAGHRLRQRHGRGDRTILRQLRAERLGDVEVAGAGEVLFDLAAPHHADVELLQRIGPVHDAHASAEPGRVAAEVGVAFDVAEEDVALS